MKNHIRLFTTAILCLAAYKSSSASESIDATRATVKEWVATENAISAEAIAWEEKKALLKDLINVTLAETNQLRESIDAIQATTTAADTVRTDLVNKQQSLSESQDLLASFLQTIEPRIIDLKTTLPQPLIDKLELFYQRVPSKPEQSTLSYVERMQTVIGILTRIQQFDQTVTVAKELRELKNGSTVEVRTLYLGLGSAYYTTRTGDDAGTGLPSANGWIWKSRPELSEKIREAITVADNPSQEARFINLPVQLSNQ